MTCRVPVLRLVRERTVPYDSRNVETAEVAAEIVRRYIGDADREHFVVLLLDTRLRVIGVHTVAIGSLNACLVHPREVFKVALLANAHAVVLAHNHPSGDPAPSPEDIGLTRKLREAGQILGIEVLDHIIIGEGQFRSLKRMGLGW